MLSELRVVSQNYIGRLKFSGVDGGLAMLQRDGLKC